MKRIVAVCLVGSMVLAPAGASVPSGIPLQGRLTDITGRAVPDGPYNVRLSLYNGPAEPQNATDTVSFSGDTITLSHRPVVVNSETVTKSDNSITYTRNIAYTMDYANGRITRTSATTIPDGTAVTVSYQWTPTASTSATQTVQAVSGVFATTMALEPYNLTGADWVQVEVDRGGAWEVLLPRIRLASVPYSLRTSSLDGASGGNVLGSLNVDGGVSATSTVYGVGSSRTILNRSITFPGLQGNGVTGLGGEAPGILAVGANSGSGTALVAQGGVKTTGSVSVGGDTNVTGQVKSAGIQTGVIVATGLTTNGYLPTVQAIHTDKDVATGNIYAQGEIAVTRGMAGASLRVGTAEVIQGLTAASANVTGTATAGALTAGSATVTGNLAADTASITGSAAVNTLNASNAVNSYYVMGSEGYFGYVHSNTFSGFGALQPDFSSVGSVWQEAGHYTQFFTLPAAIQFPSELLVDVMEYSDSSGVRTYWSPQHLTWNTTVTNGLAVSLSKTNPGSGVITYRIRAWMLR
ncbi:MAG TPA: hypothetical protein VGM51_13410 [Armatimonadota bacterium]|jgi:hypothetical protein